MYRQCAARSRALKDLLDRARYRVAQLTIAGAAFAAMAVEPGDWLSLTKWSYVQSNWPDLVASLPALSSVFGGASAICVALAALNTKQILEASFEKEWVMVRSIAEALKSEAFKFMTKAPPYSGDDAEDKLASNAIAHFAEGLPGNPVQLSDDEERKGLPETWLSAEDYISRRAQEQIDVCYKPQALKNSKIVARIRSVSLGVGVLGALIGGFAAYDPDSSWTAAWVGVVGTTTGALAAYLYSSRFQYLATSYDLTAIRLDWLIDEWQRKQRKDPNASFGEFVLKCEKAISIENATWVAEWMSEADVPNGNAGRAEGEPRPEPAG